MTLIFCSAAAYKLNSYKEFNKHPPVYAMLTDLHNFFIFCYDGSKFCLYQDEITVPARPRSAFLCGMINGLLAVTFVIEDYVNCHIVTEILFSVILQGYIQTLQAVSTRSKYWGIHGDVCAVVLASFASSTHTGYNTQLGSVWDSQVCAFFVICAFHSPSVLPHAKQMSRKPGLHWRNGTRLCLPQSMRNFF